jgi:hypothetical protein
MERGGRLSSETCVALDERRVLGRVHLGVLHPGQQLVRGDSIQVLFHLMKLKQVFYAIICALFSDIFIVRYRVELILFVPSATEFSANYLKLGLQQDSPAQPPEKLFRERGFVGCLLFSMVVFLLIMLIHVPALYDLIQSRAGAYRSVVYVWHTSAALMTGRDDAVRPPKQTHRFSGT